MPCSGRLYHLISLTIEILRHVKLIIMQSCRANLENFVSFLFLVLFCWDRVLSRIVLYRLQRVFQVVVEVQVGLHGRRHTVGASEPAETWRDRDELVKGVP